MDYLWMELPVHIYYVNPNGYYYTKYICCISAITMHDDSTDYPLWIITFYRMSTIHVLLLSELNVLFLQVSPIWLDICNHLCPINEYLLWRSSGLRSRPVCWIVQRSCPYQYSVNPHSVGTFHRFLVHTADRRSPVHQGPPGERGWGRVVEEGWHRSILGLAGFVEWASRI